MNIYTVIATRKDKPGKSLEKLLNFLNSCDICTHLIYDENSIFDAYKRGIEEVSSLKLEEDPIVIFCHDDIEILSGKDYFIECLKECTKHKAGILGVAGVTNLHPTGVWWDASYLRSGLGRGAVCHHDSVYPTIYGGYGKVEVVDGLFMAATLSNWKSISLEKPRSFEGDWDFYDILYCHRMNKQKKVNFVSPIQVRHHSSGEIADRTGWHKNREAFIANKK
jgi:hypothetical protein